MDYFYCGDHEASRPLDKAVTAEEERFVSSITTAIISFVEHVIMLSWFLEVEPWIKTGYLFTSEYANPF